MRIRKGCVFMKTNMQKLKGKIIEKGFSQETLAIAINMNKATLNRKLQNGEKFTVGEANKIVQVLGLTYQEAMEIFFTSVVA